MNRPRVLGLLFLTIFLDMLGLGILIPVFPLLVAPGSAHGAIPAGWSQSEAYVAGGWLLATFPLLQFLCAPVLGQLSDRHGRKRILSLSILGTAFSHALFAVAAHAASLPLMFAARALDGATGGNISVAQASIADASDPADRSRNFGLVGAALGLGFILGPVLGGLLCGVRIGPVSGIATPFAAAALLSLCNALLVALALPETRPAEARSSAPAVRWSRALGNVGMALSVPELRMVVPALFLFNAGFTFFSTFWGVVLAEDFGFGARGVGWFFGYMGLMIVLAQGGLVRRLPRTLRDAGVLLWSMPLVATCLLALWAVPSSAPWLLWAVPPALAVGMALARSNAMALLARVVPESVRGAAMGVHSSAYALAQLVPSALSGYVAARDARVTVLTGSVAAFAGWLLFARTFREPASLRE